MAKIWLRRPVAMIGIGLLTVIAWAGALEDDYADRMRFADGLFARQMHDLALREYAAILRAFPDGDRNDAATFRLAESLRLTQDYETAARFYGQVVAQFRDSPYRLRSAYRRARLYADAGDLASAQAHFEVILQAEPDVDLEVATRYYLGETLFLRDQLAEADAALAKLLELHPNSEFTVFALMKRAAIRRSRLAREWEAQGDLDAALVEEALAFYRLAQDRADTDRLAAEVLFQKADLYFRQDNFETAADLYRQLLRSFPEDTRVRDARLQAAWSALRSDLYAEALAVAETALAESPDEETVAEWLYVKANSQRQLLQTEAAAATYAILLARFPGSRFADASRYETAVAYYQAGQYEASIREAEQIRMSPAHRKDVHWLLAEAYAALQRPAEAVQHYRIVVREAGSSERARDALFRLAHHLRQQGSFREASQFYLQLVDTFPDSTLAPQALFASGYALSQAAAHEEAVRDWRRLVQQYPADALAEEALYQKAMGELRLERTRDALATLAELQRLFPQSRYQADSRYWQGMIHFDAGRYAAAEPLLREALALTTRDDLRRDAQFQLGLVLQRLDQPAESAALLDELIASPLRGRFPPALLEWIAAHHGAHAQYEQMASVAALLASQEDAAWQQSGQTLLGRAMAGQQAFAEAEAAWRKALAIDVRTTYAGEAALRLGLLLLEKGALEEARTYLRRVSELAAGREADAVRARSLLGLGKVALAEERADEAARLFLSVGILYDDPVLVPESLYLAATSFDKQDRKQDVQQVVAELLERYPESAWSEKARETWAL